MATAEIKAAISLDASKLNAGLRDAQNNTRAMADSMQGIGRQIAGVFSAGLVLGFARNTIAAASDIKHLADNLGISTDKLQVLRDTALATGVSFDEMQMALGKVKDAMGAAFVDENTLKRFNQLGISLDDIANNGDAADMLQRIGQSLTSAADPALAFSAVVDLIGALSAPRMIEMLRQIGELDLAAKFEEMAASGKVMSAQSIDSIEKLGTAMDRLKNTAAAAFVSVGEFIGSLPTLLDGAAGASQTAEGMIAQSEAERLRAAREAREGIIRTETGGKSTVNKEVEKYEAKTAAAKESARYEEADAAGKLAIIEERIAKARKEADAMGDKPIEQAKRRHEIELMNIQAEKQRQELRKQGERDYEQVLAKQKRDAEENQKAEEALAEFRRGRELAAMTPEQQLASLTDEAMRLQGELEAAYDPKKALELEKIGERITKTQDAAAEAEMEKQAAIERAGEVGFSPEVDQFAKIGGYVGNQRAAGDAEAVQGLEVQKRIKEILERIERKPGGLPP